jgi:hypothetical protein
MVGNRDWCAWPDRFDTEFRDCKRNEMENDVWGVETGRLGVDLSRCFFIPRTWVTSFIIFWLLLIKCTRNSICLLLIISSRHVWTNQLFLLFVFIFCFVQLLLWYLWWCDASRRQWTQQLPTRVRVAARSFFFSFCWTRGVIIIYPFAFCYLSVAPGRRCVFFFLCRILYTRPAPARPLRGGEPDPSVCAEQRWTRRSK